MNGQELLKSLEYLEPLFCLGALALIVTKKQLRDHTFLAGYLFTRMASCLILVAVLECGKVHYLSGQMNYVVYFWLYWLSYATESVLGFGIIYSIYNLAMAPLPGLRRLGMIMFRWAAGIAIAIALTTALSPQMTGMTFLQHTVSQLQQTQSILTLCMLLFVCLAIRPMGLSHRSKIFGVSLGLGITATTDLSISAWLSGLHNLASITSIIGGCSTLLAIAVWITYFAMPEPKRRMIVLPTTSPFLRWNQISLALGDEPGFVVIGEVSPEMFAPAEIEVMRRASLKMRTLTS